MTITNPILRGSSPDPTICRVGEDYYIATSTFQWFGGVQIHHSRDLKNWRLASRPLERTSQLDMRGNPDSGGIWAPHLSYHAGQFWLIFTDIKTTLGPFRDGRNYLVTCDTIDGIWSEPIFLNSSGFDPSMFHDTDGLQYVLNMVWDHRENNHSFYGIALQQYSHYRDRLVGQRKIIFTGSQFRVTEAPNLYKIGKYYYLLTAEGGTGFGHLATIARSKQLEGPYEICPEPLITSRNNPDNPLQKAGHASMVQTRDGEWYMVYLASRSVKGFSTLGRETAIARLEWRDDWPYVVGGTEPTLEVECHLPESPFDCDCNAVDHFDADKLNIHFQTLRIPATELTASLTERPGHLRLFGRESLTSTFTTSLVARRWTSLNLEATTAMAFEPNNFQQMAGMTNYYDTQNWTALYVTHHEDKGRVLDVATMDNGTYANPISGREIPVPADCEYVHLRTKACGDTYSYLYSFAQSPTEADWRELPLTLDSTRLSDEYVKGAGFTGAFVGMFAVDISGAGLPADFDYFAYKNC